MCQLTGIILACSSFLVFAQKRLKITNGCADHPMWIAHEAGPHVGVDGQDVRLAPGQTFFFNTPDGFSATRYWPKMFCNAQGQQCKLGGSGGPGEWCIGPLQDYKKCAPPIDTKFEATFGHSSQPCDPLHGQVQGCDFVDMSLVDGFTLPFRLDVENGQCFGGSTGGPVASSLDCSGLNFDECPEETFSAAGITVDLKAINPHTSAVAGCYAPCSRLVFHKWDNPVARGRQRTDPQVAPYCCPTPPLTADQCKAGPVAKTQYVNLVHAKCPGVYGYSYDDAIGLLRCTMSSSYHLTFFCPAGKGAIPGTGCSTVCRFHNISASCEERIQYVLKTQKLEIDRAHAVVLADCPVCSACSVEDATTLAMQMYSQPLTKPAKVAVSASGGLPWVVAACALTLAFSLIAIRCRGPALELQVASAEPGEDQALVEPMVTGEC